MSEAAPSSAGRERADLEAAAWLIKQDRGLTPAEQDKFLHWLAADPENQAWLARHRRTWQEFNLLAQWRPEHSVDPNPDLLARPRRLRSAAWLWSGALAAASIAVAWVFWGAQGDKSPRAFPAEIVAAAYEQQVLEDGSIVDLNGGARLTIQFSPGERRVTLWRGEAQFTVAKNAARPFIVHAGGVDVRAVGTAFNVRLDDGSVEVLVTEGKVQLDRRPGPAGPGMGGKDTAPAAGVTIVPLSVPAVIAGERAVISLAPDSGAPHVVAATVRDMSRLLAWQPQLLEFDSTPLGEVVAEFNRRNRTQLIVLDAELRTLPIVASFRSNNIDGFVRLLEVTAGVRAERRGAGEIVLRKVTRR